MSDQTLQPAGLGLPHLNAFDRLVLVAIAILIAIIAGVVLLGDNVGVQIRRAGPADDASSTARVAIQFSEAMNWEQAVEHMRFDPPLTGDFSWSGTTLRFQADEALQPGQTYTVTLGAGATSRSGRVLLRDYVYSFTVRTPRVAYLAPSDALPQNVWIASATNPDDARQVTFSTSGIVNFDISPDGTRIAYAERQSGTGTSNIMLMDLQTGVIQQLTNCPDSDCNTPDWRPDGQLIAYERVDLNSDMNIGVSPTRIWLIDLTTTPPTNRPLFSDSQILGYAPRWSADGTHISLFDNNSRGILIYNFADTSTTLIPTISGGGDISLSPDGARVVFPRLILDGAGGARSNLQIADLTSGRIADLTAPDDVMADDAQSAWRPDGSALAITRRDERVGRTRQLYLIDMTDPDYPVEPLLIEPRYYHGFFFWSPQGDQLAIHRFPELNEDGTPNAAGRPEVWVYDVEEDRLTMIADNAMFPRWVP